MSWRPNNWDKIRSTWLEQNFTTGKMKQKTFDAGANAMLREFLDWIEAHKIAGYSIELGIGEIISIPAKDLESLKED